MIPFERLDVITDLYQTIHNNWAKKNRFEYVVIPAADIRGLPFDKMKELTFRVGVDESETIPLSLQELTALFLFISDQAKQMKQAKEARGAGKRPDEQTLSSIVNLDPSDDMIKSVLPGIQFTLHVDKEDNVDKDNHHAPDGDADGNQQAKSVGDFGLTEDRVNFVFTLIRKKINLSLAGKGGFRVYPPAEFLDRAEVLNDADVYEKLKDTVWWVRWNNGGEYDQLTFMEFLVFVQQIIQSRQAFEEAQKAAAKHSSSHRGSKHAGGWQPKKDRSRKPKKRGEDDWVRINVKGLGFAPAELAKDEMVRVLFSKVDLESTTRPAQAMN